MIRFTIIIPIYNVEQYLRDCLNSVVNQTYTDYEVICVNDGSTDRSLTIVEEYQQKYPQIIIISQPNKGLSAARNVGIKAAKGDFVFLLDSDDWIETNTLKILSEKQNGEDMICFNGRRYFEDGKDEIQDLGISDDNLKGWDYYNKYALSSRNFHFVCSVLRIYKREFLLKNKLFFEVGIFHEDNLFTPLACYHAQKVKVIPDCLYIYRIREGSITKTVNIQRLFDLITVSKKLSDFFIPKINIDKRQIYREIVISVVNLFNMIHSWKMDEILDSIYNQVDMKTLKKIIVDFDMFILYFFIKNKYWKFFYIAHYFDFYFCRKYYQKIKNYIKKIYNSNK